MILSKTDAGVPLRYRICHKVHGVFLLGCVVQGNFSQLFSVYGSRVHAAIEELFPVIIFSWLAGRQVPSTRPSLCDFSPELLLTAHGEMCQGKMGSGYRMYRDFFPVRRSSDNPMVSGRKTDVAICSYYPWNEHFGEEWALVGFSKNDASHYVLFRRGIPVSRHVGTPGEEMNDSSFQCFYFLPRISVFYGDEKFICIERKYPGWWLVLCQFMHERGKHFRLAVQRLLIRSEVHCYILLLEHVENRRRVICGLV